MLVQRGFRDKLVNCGIDINAPFEVVVSVKGKATYDICCFGLSAEEKLIKMGYSPINPVKNAPGGQTWEYYLRNDIIKLMCCDSIYMLKGWRSSRGARLEHYIAKKLGFKIIYEH